HFGGELLGIIARDVLALAETVVLGEVPVQLTIARDGDADGGGDQAVGLAGRGFRHDDERDLPRLQPLHAVTARQDLALGRENAGDAYEVAGGDSGGAEGQLERGQLLAVLADALREKHLLRNESDHVTL